MYFQNDLCRSEDHKNVTKTSLIICKAAVAISASVEGVQLINNIWRLYPTSDAARNKLLQVGLNLDGKKITVRDTCPTTGHDPNNVKIFFRKFPLSMNNSAFKLYLEGKGIELASDIKFDYIRDPDTNKLTKFKSGDRFVYTKPFDIPLPRNDTIEQTQGKIFHRDQVTIECKICQGNHKTGSDTCKHYLELNNVTTIQGHTNILSNFHDSPIVEDGIPYPSVEHAYQCKRAREQKREDLCEEILNATHAGKAKGIAKALAPGDEIYNLDIMEGLLRNKINSHFAARESLRESGQGIIAHTIPDLFWGTGLSPEISVRVDPQFWPGKNKLGEILMKLREETFLQNSSDRNTRKKGKNMKQGTIAFEKKDDTSGRDRSSSSKRGRSPNSPQDKNTSAPAKKASTN